MVVTLSEIVTEVKSLSLKTPTSRVVTLLEMVTEVKEFSAKQFAPEKSHCQGL